MASRFKKPAWLLKQQAASQATTSTPGNSTKSAVDVFSRAADTHAQILAEQEENEKRLKEKEQRRKERKERVRLEREEQDKKLREHVLLRAAVGDSKANN